MQCVFVLMFHLCIARESRASWNNGLVDFIIGFSLTVIMKIYIIWMQVYDRECWFFHLLFFQFVSYFLVDMVHSNGKCVG